MTEPYRSPLPLLSADQADPDAAARLEGTSRALGFVPNMYAALANSPGLLATYLDGYQRFMTGSGFTPIEAQVIFLAINRHNECTYCMSVHSVVAQNMAKAPLEVIDALRNDTPIPDARLQALADFTTAMVSSSGHPTRAQADAFLAAGYTDRQVQEILLAIAVKTISNWNNHLFATPLDDQFTHRAWSAPDHG